MLNFTKLCLKKKKLFKWPHNSLLSSINVVSCEFLMLNSELFNVQLISWDKPVLELKYVCIFITGFNLIILYVGFFPTYVHK